ncbi:MAG TPA: ABC transporter ATP-binding protein [Rhodopila sp.]|jgi:oligopeptide/dipeptide ABC transporter ATP-binding protein
MTTLLDVQNLVKRFPLAGTGKVVQAVNDISFTIGRGETLALVGESGSGKTTVGRCILGLIDATRGEIWFDGVRMGGGHNIRSKALRGRIQLVFQEPAESLDPRIRVGETLAEPLRHLGMSRADRDRRAREIAEHLGLKPRVLEQFPAELSAGLQQRIGIGRAVVTRPELIILDEPTSALDPTARAEIVDLLIRLQHEFGTAYLLITHDLSTVRFVSHRVAVMYLGTIVEEAPAETLFAQPLHPYSLGLLASVLLPDPDLRPANTIRLDGEIPSPIDLPPGCPLSGRCPFAEPRCRAERPPPVMVAPHHAVSCFYHEKVAALGRTTDNFARFQAESTKLLSAGAVFESAPEKEESHHG